jgi:hypothetical protein
MRTARTITASLAAILAAAALAGPAAANPADATHHQASAATGRSTTDGLRRSDSSRDPATANVYVQPSGFDWGSAGIGAAAGIGAFAIALAGTSGMRRRRVRRPSSVATH